jgi:hypothetical protein
MQPPGAKLDAVLRANRDVGGVFHRSFRILRNVERSGTENGARKYQQREDKESYGSGSGDPLSHESIVGTTIRVSAVAEKWLNFAPLAQASNVFQSGSSFDQTIGAATARLQ